MALQRLEGSRREGQVRLSTRLSDRDRPAVHLRRLVWPQASQHGPQPAGVRIADHELLERTIEPCRRCLADANLKPEQIEEVLLVGGQTRAPKVSEIVRRALWSRANPAVNPDEGVAMAAAIQSGIMAGEVKELVLLDVTPAHLGNRDQGRTLHVADRSQQHHPHAQEPRVHNGRRNQTKVEVHVLQGESDMGRLQQEPCEIRADQHPASAKGVPQVEVSFEIDVNGIVSVSALDQATGRSQSMVIHPSGGLSQSELNRLVGETRQQDQSDRQRREQKRSLASSRGWSRIRCARSRHWRAS